MQSFVISKYHRPVVLASLAASLLMGAISAPAWAASTDMIANNSPSASTTSGKAQITLDGSQLQGIFSNPKVQDSIVHSILSNPKTQDSIVHYLKDQKIKSNLKSNIGPVVSSNIPNIPENAQNPSTPVEAPNAPNTPANGQNQSNTLWSVQYPSISRYGQNPSSIPGAVLLTPNPAITPYGALSTQKMYIKPYGASTVYVLIH